MQDSNPGSSGDWWRGVSTSELEYRLAVPMQIRTSVVLVNADRDAEYPVFALDSQSNFLVLYFIGRAYVHLVLLE
jgi:hypothetical protein